MVSKMAEGDRSPSNFIQIVRIRRSVRKYADTPIEQDKIDHLREVAREGTRALGFISPLFLFVIDQGKKRGLSRAVFSGWLGKVNPWILTTRAPCLIVACGNRTEASVVGDKHLYLAETAIVMELVVLAAAEMALDSGKATEHFSRMVALLGGPADFVERMDAHLVPAPIVRDIMAPAAGVVAAIDTHGVGMGVVALGGGRRLPTDAIDHAVGFSGLAGLGARVDVHTRWGIVHARGETEAKEAERRLLAAYSIGEKAESHPLIADRILPPPPDHTLPLAGRDGEGVEAPTKGS